MYAHVQYPDTIEPQVQFVEETAPEDIVEKTIEQLRNGVSLEEMCIASALAVIRSSEIPFFPTGQWGHHGGHLHPISGLHAVRETASRLPGARRFLPVVQNVALSNKHIHDPAMGPYLLPEFVPLDAGGVAETKQAFFDAVRRGSVNIADHHFLWLVQNLPPDQSLDVLLTVAIPKNLMDDHKFIYPIYTWRLLDWIDSGYFQVLVRGPVRYISQPPSANPVEKVVALIEEYQLLDKPLRQQTGADEAESIMQAREAMNANFEDLPEITARALADGLSLEGTSEALTLAASNLFLRLDTENPMDVHMQTACNVRHHLLGLKGVSAENKISALLLWNSGPEVRNATNRLAPDHQPHPDTVAAIPSHSQARFLDTIHDAIAANDVEGAIAHVAKYGELEYETQPLIALLAEIACQDNITEMHSIKHHQACVEAFMYTRAPFRFRHLIAASKAAAVSYGKARDVYERANPLLN